MVQSVRVPKNCPDEYRKIVESVDYRKKVESGRLPGKGRIRTSTQKLSGRVLKNGTISVSTGKLLNPGEYREKVESVRVSENCHDEY